MVKKAKKTPKKAALKKSVAPSALGTETSRGKHDERAASDEDKRLGEKIRARRLEIGMSQERLAELVGVTFQQIQKYEKGMNRVAWPRLLQILEALDLTFDTFVERMGLERGKPGKNEPTFPANAREVKMAVTFRKASPAVQERLLALMEAMTGNGDH